MFSITGRKSAVCLAVLFSVNLLFGDSPLAYPVSVATYYDQNQWLNAATTGGQNPLTNISLDASNWSESIVPSQHGPEDDGVAVSLGGGISVTINHQNYLNGQPSVPLFSNNSIANGIVGFHDDYIFTFGTPIYAFGANFTTTGPIPYPYGYLTIQGLISNLGFTDVVGNGFFGVLSATPFSSIELLAGDCVNSATDSCGTGAVFTMTNLNVSTTPTPEPGSAALLLFAIPIVAYVMRNRTRAGLPVATGLDSE